MAIAVVIAAYNAEPYLAETLTSVLAQTVRPDEVIVVDDGSKDRTAEIAESFGAPVRVFRRTNQRQGAARNFGVAQAASDLIAFIDADDLWEPQKLEKQLQAMARVAHADLCYTGHVNFHRVDGEERLSNPWSDREVTASVREFVVKEHFLPSAILMKRETFLRFGGFRLDFRICEDMDLFLRMHRAGAKFVGCPEYLLRRRMHGNNVSSNFLIMHAEREQVMKELVLPHLHGIERLTLLAEYHSYADAELAYLQRSQGDPAALKTLARSILLQPFGDTMRHKVFLHMLLTRLGVLRPKPKASVVS